jgi:hypothetical protein
MEHNMCVVIVSTNFVRNIFHSKMNAGDYIIDIRRSTCKITVILSDFIKKNYLQIFKKIFKNKNS